MGDVFVVLALILLVCACILLIHTVIKKTLGITTIFEYEKGLKYSCGKFIEVLTAGQYWYLSLTTTIYKIDMRPTYMTISSQEVLSADGIPVKISMAVQYQIIDPEVAINQNEDYTQSMYLSLQLSLREIVATVKIDELMEARKTINGRLLEVAVQKLEGLGLEVQTVELKDITFSGELKKIFSKVVEAQKESLAQLERARGEAAALRNLANTAKMMENNPALMQLRILQTLGESKGNTVVLNMNNEGASFLRKLPEKKQSTAKGEN